ncbi:hypothetical protein DES40_1708 [Litorimonas taeanensis]|uniref:Uncharacterized protein n=1 Tax=Litorimonas taeanensis TaxID=568099 RepID=A0A420WDG4_9PROT|nr:hypothetical protein [Litorimonas taeanensis]RKQ68932.1 hypothetical protein DES40_1708 [Litorimonas taeanensis]
MLSFLLKPKFLFGLGGVLALLGMGLFIRAQILDYGKAQFALGVSRTERAFAEQAQKTKSKLDDNADAAAAEADKTDSVYIEVIKEVAAIDAAVIAENTALRNTLKSLKLEIENANPILPDCATTPLPSTSLSIHTDIDRLLRSR